MDIGGLIVPNVSLALVSGAYAVYPDRWYPLSAGCLGIGAPAVNQTFTLDNEPSINASLIPWWLKLQDQIPSSSFSMHIGSASPPMPGSFYFGGYDQNRVVGDILTETDDITKAITLRDISINVVDGSSPWEFDSKDGLLTTDNSSTTPGILVSVDGCSPYLTLPRSTCDAIAQYLPVKYNTGLGLYMWQTDDPKYSQIVSSASALEFKFLAGSNTQYVTISVPFRHLNLTLTQPLVDKDQPYFPCYTGSNTGYTLGRAFLQDAFIGANWGAKTWWLAQAPGPNIPNSRVIALAPGDIEIQASANDWKESWSGSWKVLTPGDVGGSPENTSPIPTANSTSPGGLSTGAAAGVGVGVGLGGIAIIGVLFFCWRRRKPSLKTEPNSQVSNSAPAAPYDIQTMSFEPQDGNIPQNGYSAQYKNSAATRTSSNSGIYSNDPNLSNADPATFGQQYLQHYQQSYPQPHPQQRGVELSATGQITELPSTEMHNHQAGTAPPPIILTQASSHEI
ncbi:aspartic peptidase domain-containing protein [Astrocystis sublimbata]|nr:aspartic peptidase domain-containing protein [Astrocystis sublimbata]